jgi:tRNA(Ile)-lysidine synthase
VPPFADKLLEQIRKHDLLKPGDRVGVAVSGGPDSVALLRLLLQLRKELGIVLSVVHLNHKLRGTESDEDHQFVARLASEYKLPLHASSGDVPKRAAEAHMSFETAAREVRYDYFKQLLHDRLLDKVVTGHTLDDQAETVLMRIMRGTGMKGLRAIQPRIVVEGDDYSGEVVRPLLSFRRRELQEYLNALGQSWREDSTNLDSKYTRNRVRQKLLPLLEEEFNPSFAQTLAELAEIARAEEDYWESEIEGWMGTVVQWTPAKPLVPTNFVPLAQIGSSSDLNTTVAAEDEPKNAIVNRNWLLSEPLALQRRAIKSIFDHARVPLEFKHIEEILHFAASESGNGQLMLPSGWKLLREDASLEFKAPQPDMPAETDYEYSLPVPGEVEIKEAGVVLKASSLKPGQIAAYKEDELFDPSRLSQMLVVRNWRPGDRFWPAHTKAPKKIKELLQDRHVPQPERRAWPVVVSGDEIIWVRGFPGRAHFRPGNGESAVLISESGCPSAERDEQGSAVL